MANANDNQNADDSQTENEEDNSPRENSVPDAKVVPRDLDQDESAPSGSEVMPREITSPGVQPSFSIPEHYVDTDVTNTGRKKVRRERLYQAERQRRIHRELRFWRALALVLLGIWLLTIGWLVGQLGPRVYPSTPDVSVVPRHVD